MFRGNTWKREDVRERMGEMLETIKTKSSIDLLEADKVCSEEVKDATSTIRKSFGSGTLAYANHDGGILYFNSSSSKDENWIYYQNHKEKIQVFKRPAKVESQRILVYEYVPNGSLEKFLFHSGKVEYTNDEQDLEESKLLDRKPILDWGIRYRIALGVARAIAYLHEECMEWVLHCDIKPENILLAADFFPKISDFGLSKLRKKEDMSRSHRKHLLQMGKQSTGRMPFKIYALLNPPPISACKTLDFTWRTLGNGGGSENVDTLSTVPSNIFATFPIDGLISGRSCRHHIAVFTIREIFVQIQDRNLITSSI
ncbi:hypothetical protein L1887_09675 [Cichorium endivia]|nr:hypothetical protein L1887_09675 [Cichorium endivia]